MKKILSRLRERKTTQRVVWVLIVSFILLFLAGFLIGHDRVWINPVNEIEDIQQ